MGAIFRPLIAIDCHKLKRECCRRSDALARILNLQPSGGVLLREGPWILESDEELIRRVVGRDSDAFDTLMLRHEQTLRPRIAQIVHEPGATDDLVQEVFLRLWTQAGQLTAGGSVGGWLWRTATNLALNHLRSVRRRRVGPMPRRDRNDPDADKDEVALADPAGLTPDELAGLAERSQLLASLIEALPESKRQVCRLVYQQELDVAAAADRLGIPPGTVKSRLYHARRMLAEAWKEIDSEWESD